MKKLVNYEELTWQIVIFLPVILFLFTLGYATATWAVKPKLVDLHLNRHKVTVENINLRSELRAARSKIKALEDDAKSLRTSYTKHSRQMEVSGYSLRSCETDSDPEWSALGPTVYGQVAISPNLLKSGDFSRGDHVLITTQDGKKYFRVINDKMNVRYKSNMDLLFTNTYAANLFGRQQATITNLTKINHELRNL